VPKTACLRARFCGSTEPRPTGSGTLSRVLNVKKIAGALCALLWLSMAALAVDFAALQPQGYVSDFAQAIDPASRAALENYCGRVEALTGAQIAVVTVETLAGEPVEDVANALYTKWGIGKKTTNEGILLLLAIQDHRDRLEIGYGLEPIITDGVSGSILRAMSPALKESRYGEAAIEAVRLLGARIAEAKGVQIDAALPQRTRRAARSSFPWPLAIIGLFLLFQLLAGIGGKGGRRGGGSGTGFLLGMLLGNTMGRSMGSGGGGFGGFDSGGGFGGFGGGGSGGGGASGSW
jgi:uncharacterized protein